MGKLHDKCQDKFVEFLKKRTIADRILIEEEFNIYGSRGWVDIACFIDFRKKLYLIQVKTKSEGIRDIGKLIRKIKSAHKNYPIVKGCNNYSIHSVLLIPNNDELFNDIIKRKNLFLNCGIYNFEIAVFDYEKEELSRIPIIRKGKTYVPNIKKILKILKNHQYKKITFKKIKNELYTYNIP